MLAIAMPRPPAAPIRALPQSKPPPAGAVVRTVLTTTVGSELVPGNWVRASEAGISTCPVCGFAADVRLPAGRSTTTVGWELVPGYWMRASRAGIVIGPAM